MVKMRRLVLAVLFISLCGHSFSQPKTGAVAGFISEPSTDGKGQTGISNVHIIVCSERDTIETVTSRSEFYISNIPVGKAILHFSHVGYKKVIKEVDIRPGAITKLSVSLKEEVYNLGSVTVKSSVPLFTIKNDTIIFNAAAVKTLEGDETIEILKQMPGVLMSGGKINVMGKDVQLTYIDGKLIFGRDPMTALNNLMAADVIKIRAYDELRNKGIHGNPDDLIRVLDIETKSKLVAAVTGHFLASSGSDLPAKGEKGRYRYGIGATANFFSENLLLSANILTDNVNRSSNRLKDLLERKISGGSGYNRSTYANAALERHWGQDNSTTPLDLNVNYSYRADHSENQSIRNRIYFPSMQSGNSNRIIDDSTRNITGRKMHTNNISLEISLPKPGIFFLNHSLVFTDNSADTYRSYINKRDGAPATGTQTTLNSNNSQYSLSELLSWMQGTASQKWFFRANANLSLGKGDGSSVKYDSLLSTGSVTILSSSPVEISKNISGSTNIRYNIDPLKNWYIALDYQYSYKNELKKQTAFNTADGINGEADPVNTFDYTTNNHNHTATLEYHKNFYTIYLGASTTLVDKQERLPMQSGYNSRFNAVLPRFSISSPGLISNFNVSYSTINIVPYVEQLRPQLDNQNLFRLIAGNPDLRQSYRHTLTGNYNRMIGKSNSSLRIQANMDYTNNPVVTSTRFYDRDTLLEKYGGYQAPAGSSLTTYENVDRLWSANLNINYQTYIRFIKSSLTFKTSFNFDETPSLREEQLIRRKRYSPGIYLSLSSNFSRTVKFTLGSATNYNYAINNTGDTDKYLQESLTANTTIDNIFKHLVFNASYSGIFYRGIGDRSRHMGTSEQYNSHILNLSLGCKLLKRMGEVNIAVFDLFNRTSGFSTNMNADYIENTWRQPFGRYYILNFAIKFNKVKPGVSYKGRMNDGSAIDKIL